MTAPRNGIVAGYDGSPGSDQAQRRAVEETRAHGCPLTACPAWAPHYLTVPGDPAVYALAQNRGEHIPAAGVSYARPAPGTEPVVPLPARGSPAQVPCGHSACAQMVVPGARGQGGTAGPAPGSVPWQVAGHAQGPVVIVRARPRRASQPQGPAAAGADGSAGSQDVIRFAFREAEPRRAPVPAVCALADAPAAPGGASRVEADLDRLLTPREKEHPGLTVPRQVPAGPPRAVLLQAAPGAQLPVIGSRGRGGPDDMSEPRPGSARPAAPRALPRRGSSRAAASGSCPRPEDGGGPPAASGPRTAIVPALPAIQGGVTNVRAGAAASW